MSIQAHAVRHTIEEPMNNNELKEMKNGYKTNA